ncbi:hypothetical protein RIF29_40565 [Crotalaria pallida]|uniref:SAGA-associated factor 11 n=1 Tax=Crotalaria pallida TaxID=3830 RepID=A0AAN9HQT3_CROPI
MVCSFGSGRMEAMARLLAAGTFSHNAADDFARQKSAAEYICRELREADEANLLDEEDMHVYGERPMTDSLQLVWCNVCKKPIKDSQYAAHAELCRSLTLTEQTSLELNGSTGNRKPARKEKKKLSTSCANQATALGERRMSESMDYIDTAVSRSHLKSQIRVIPFNNEAKDAAFMMDGTGSINHGSRDHLASVVHPPTKIHKLIASSHLPLPLPESHGMISGVTKFVNFVDGITRKDLLEGTVSEPVNPNHKNIGLIHEQPATSNDFPAPLATKIYYSQRSNRLRAAVNNLYFQNLSEDMCTDVMSSNTSHGDMVAFQDPCPSFDQMGNVLYQEHSPTLCSAQNLAKSSEVCLLKAGAIPTGGLSNPFLVDSVSRSASTHVGLTRNNFLPKSYPFANNSGNPLGTMQQPSGSVPVI